MWTAIVDFVKGLFGGGHGGIQVGKDNKNISVQAGDKSPIIAAGLLN